MVDRYGISPLPCDKLKMKFLNSIIMRVSCTLKYIHIEQVERMIVEEKQYIL